MDIKQLPAATTLGEALRRMGKFSSIRDCWVKVNHIPLRSALHRCKKMTLDIDATEVSAWKEYANWTHEKNKGFMPMV